MKQSELGVDGVIKEVIEYAKTYPPEDSPPRAVSIRQRLRDMAPFLEYLVSEIMGPERASRLSREDRSILCFAIYDIIVGHRVSKLRKIGGYYSNHPIEAAGILGRSGCDLCTVLVALYHDLPEEAVSRRLKDRRTEIVAELKNRFIKLQDMQLYQGMENLDRADLARVEAQQRSQIEAAQDEAKRRFLLHCFEEFKARMLGLIEEYEKALAAQLGEVAERRLIAEGVAEHRRNFEESLRSLGTRCLRRKHLSYTLFRNVGFLTRTANENYYRTIGRLLYPIVKYRALLVKFSDKIANARDVNRQLYAPGVREIPSGIEYFGADEVPIERSVVPLLKNWSKISAGETWIPVDGLYSQIQANYELEEEYQRRVVREEQAPQRLKGKERLKQFYKNFIAVNEIRLKYSVGSMPPLLRQFEMELLRETRREASNIIKHLISCHAVRSGERFTLERGSRIYHETIAYMKAGGLTRVTRPKDRSALDGLFSRCFDSSVRGDSAPLQELYANKDLMFGAALAFYAMAQYYLDDKNFILAGLDRTGLHPQ